MAQGTENDEPTSWTLLTFEVISTETLKVTLQPPERELESNFTNL